MITKASIQENSDGVLITYFMISIHSFLVPFVLDIEYHVSNAVLVE